MSWSHLEWTGASKREVDTGHWDCPRTMIGTLRSVTSSNPECPVEPPVFQGTACIEILEMSECPPAIVGTLKPPTTGVILTVDHDKESKNSQDLSCVLCLQRKDLKSNLQGEKHHPLQAVNEVEEIGGKVRVERDAIYGHLPKMKPFTSRTICSSPNLCPQKKVCTAYLQAEPPSFHRQGKTGKNSDLVSKPAALLVKPHCV